MIDILYWILVIAMSVLFAVLIWTMTADHIEKNSNFVARLRKLLSRASPVDDKELAEVVRNAGPVMFDTIDRQVKEINELKGEEKK
jgi:hypothetical protein